MATPSTRSVIEYMETVNTATHTITWPAGIQVGDYFVGVLSFAKTLSSIYAINIYNKTSNVSTYKFYQGAYSAGPISECMFSGIWEAGTTLQIQIVNLLGVPYSLKCNWMVGAYYNHGMIGSSTFHFAQDYNFSDILNDLPYIGNVSSAPPSIKDYLFISFVSHNSNWHEIGGLYLYPPSGWTLDNEIYQVVNDIKYDQLSSMMMCHYAATTDSIGAYQAIGLIAEQNYWASLTTMVYPSSGGTTPGGIGIYIPQNSIGMA